MTDLFKKLEDKKKGCGRFYKWVDEEHEYFLSCSDECLDNYCPQCQAEIAILEQAIAEIQKQRQDFERILNRIIGKLEDRRNQREEITDYCKAKKQQLNQPKTEK